MNIAKRTFSVCTSSKRGKNSTAFNFADKRIDVNNGRLTRPTSKSGNDFLNEK